jgi:hypothetical protein
MCQNTTDTEDGNGEQLSTTEKRAKWEHLRIVACDGAGYANVTNYSYGVQAARAGEHTYSVELADAEPVSCGCPAFEYQPGDCKHMITVSNEPDVITAATAAKQVAADGGHDDERYSVGYSITIDGTPFAGSFTVENTGMSDSAAVQYAANHLLDTTDVEPGSFDVRAIDVEYREVGR